MPLPDSSQTTTRNRDVYSRRGLLGKGAAVALAVPAATSLLASPAGAASRNRTRASAKRIKVTFVGSLRGFPFWNQIQRGAEDAGRDLADLDLKFTAPTTYTGSAQIEKFIRAAVSGKPQGIAIDYFGREYDAVLKKALDQGTVVQFYNNYVAAETAKDPRIRILGDSAVGLNKDAVCFRTAKAFTQFVKPGDEVVFFNQLPGKDEWDRIESAYVAAFQKLGWSKNQIKVFPVGLDPAKNLELIRTYLTAHPGTKGMVCADVNSGGPAVKAKKALGLKTPLLSWNLEPSTFADIKSGAISLNLTQQPYLQSYYAVVALYMKLKYQFLAPPSVDPGTLYITKANATAVEKQYKAGIAG